MSEGIGVARLELDFRVGVSLVVELHALDLAGDPEIRTSDSTASWVASSNGTVNR